MNEKEHTQIADIQYTVHHLDKRVTVLETRADAQAEAIKSIQSDVRENKKLSMQILEMLSDDSRSRTKLAWGVVATLIGVLGTLVVSLVTI